MHFPIAHLIDQFAAKGEPLFLRSLSHALLPTEAGVSDFLAPLSPIVMVGYPNGLWDDVNNFPIFRQGAAATHPLVKWRGQDKFLIDAACFPGSSGSPVFLYESDPLNPATNTRSIGQRLFSLLGVMHAGPQHVVTMVELAARAAVPIVPNNLGYVIRSDRLRDFDALILASLAAGDA